MRRGESPEEKKVTESVVRFANGLGNEAKRGGFGRGVGGGVGYSAPHWGATGCPGAGGVPEVVRGGRVLVWWP